MKVSAVIPTYNRESDVIRAIASVFAQTAPVCEVIVIDDGSSDNTVAAIQRHFGERVILLKQQRLGVSAARNTGIHRAQGEWIAFLDSDDVWSEDKNELQIEALRQAGEKAGVCFSDNWYGGNPEMTFSRFEETNFRSPLEFGVLHHPIDYILTGREPFFTSALLIRRSLLLDEGGFDHKLILREDTDLLFRLALKTSFAFVNKPLVMIDRTPTREEGLCKLYGTRVDTLFDCSERLYTNWLLLPEVRGSQYERPIRQLLRLSHYDSAEAKFHELRFTAALREIRQIRRLGQGLLSIALTLLVRKIQKWARRREESKARRARQQGASQFDAA